LGAALEEAAMLARSWAGVTATACSGLSLEVVSSLWPAFVTTLKGVAGVILFMLPSNASDAKEIQGYR